MLITKNDSFTVTYQEGKGYKKCIGTYLHSDGRPRPKIFWLGHNHEHALLCARLIATVLGQLRHDNPSYTHWTPEGLALAKDCVDVQTENWTRMVESAQLTLKQLQPAQPITRWQPTTTAAGSADATNPATTLYAAVDAYVAAMQAKPLSPSYKRRLAETLEDLKYFRDDCALSTIDRVWLEQLSDEIKGRPRGRRKNGRTGRREPIKPATVKTYLQHWRQAFDWIDRASDSRRFGGWEAPKRMVDLFECDLNKLRTKAERDKAADGPDHLTVDEIQKLMAAATPRQRMFILMGLFTGQGQTELRWTRRDEFDLDNAAFAHRRNKTGQLGKYWLPPELVNLLRDYFNKVRTNKEKLAFLTRDREPLVTEKSDSVRQMFDDVREAACISRQGVTFYACRRFLGDRAKRKGGAELRDAALAHAGHSVGDRHYSNYRDFSQVEAVAREIYEEFKAAGVFDFAAERPEGVAEARGKRPLPVRKEKAACSNGAAEWTAGRIGRASPDPRSSGPKVRDGRGSTPGSGGRRSADSQPRLQPQSLPP